VIYNEMKIKNELNNLDLTQKEKEKIMWW